MCDWFGFGLQPCVYERVNGSAMAVSVGECTATVCTSEEEGFQKSMSVCEYLFVCLWMCMCETAAASKCGGMGMRGWGGVGGMQCSEGGMDINHQEEHGSVAPHGDGWGVSAVMSP